MADIENLPKDDISKSDISEPLLAESEEKKGKQVTRTASNWVFLYTACFIITIIAALVMLIGPFLAEEVADWGASKTVNGVVFAVYPFAMLIFSPLAAIFGQGDNRGRRKVVIIGMILEAVTAMCSGFVTLFIPATKGHDGKIPSSKGRMRLLAFSLFRAVQGMGGSMSWTGMTAITADQFPDRLGFAMGLQETFAGIGFMIGPAIGGILYACGGFYLPFVVMGSLLAAATPILYIVLLKIERRTDAESESQSLIDPLVDDPAPEKESDNSWELIWKNNSIIAKIAAVNFVTFCGMAGLGVLNPTLQRHIESYLTGITKSNIGVVFALAAVTYGALAPFAGHMADKLGSIPVMFLGGLVSSISFLMIGPTPLIGFLSNIKGSTSRWLIEVTGLLALGAGTALSIIPVMPYTKTSLENIMDSSTAGDVSSALFTAVISLGDACGPLIGGVLEATVGFATGTTIMAACTLASALLLLPFFIREGKSRSST